ncbi:hypothetical protein [Pseudodesulfovibrio methanolicus]|uniref:Uncharacterized protein n=1 Tax=Pseudodesulfovibrio methanolicus TaxID=3126690 RepID=A0ABZ2IZF0_9BACT
MSSMKAPLRIPATKGKNAWPRLSIFPGDYGENWPNYGGRKDNFRLQIGDSFYSRPGERKSFLSPAELGQVLGQRIAEVFGVEAGTVSDGTVRVNLYLPQGAKVWYREGGMLPEADMIGAPPWLNGDGEWVVTLAYSRKTVSVTTVKPRTAPLAECSIEPEEYGVKSL